MNTYIIEKELYKNVSFYLDQICFKQVLENHIRIKFMTKTIENKIVIQLSDIIKKEE